MLRALLFDLGDTIMQEETEVKNEDGITLSAELFVLRLRGEVDNKPQVE